MWLILLSLFGMTQERRWRRATGWIVAIYLAAQSHRHHDHLSGRGAVCCPGSMESRLRSIPLPLYMFSSSSAFGLMRRNGFRYGR